MCLLRYHYEALSLPAPHSMKVAPREGTTNQKQLGHKHDADHSQEIANMLGSPASSLRLETITCSLHRALWFILVPTKGVWRVAAIGCQNPGHLTWLWCYHDEGVRGLVATKKTCRIVCEAEKSDVCDRWWVSIIMVIGVEEEGAMWWGQIVRQHQAKAYTKQRTSGLPSFASWRVVHRWWLINSMMQ